MDIPQFTFHSPRQWGVWLATTGAVMNNALKPFHMDICGQVLSYPLGKERAEESPRFPNNC